MIKKITDSLYHPIIYFFLLPLISLVPGTIFAFQYSPINFISLIALYVYIVINQLIENILMRIPTSNFELSKTLLISLEIITGTFILFFSLRHSWISGAILLLYTIIIQLQFLFTYYELEKTAALLASFLKVILLNSIGFYIHANFIHFRFFPYYLGLFLPYFIYELTRTEESVDNRLISLVMILNYLFVFILLWKTTGLSIILLLLPFAFIATFKNYRKQKYMATFLITFSFIYIGLLYFTFIL